MPRKVPDKSSFRVVVPDVFMSEIDEVVREDGYNGRSELALRLLRNYIDERKKNERIKMEYELMKKEESSKGKDNENNE